MDITELLLHRPAVSPDQGAPARHAIYAEARDAEQLRDAARQFETVLLHQIVKQMSETVNYTSLDEDDDTGQQIQGMYWTFMAEAMGEQGGLGFWKTIYDDLAQIQGIDTQRFPADGSSRLDQRG